MMENDQFQERIALIEKQGRQLRIAICAAITTICVLLGIWNLYQSLSILKFSEIYDQMLNGKALPTLSQFVVSHPTSLFYLSLALPLSALALAFFRSRKTSSVWFLLAIMLITALQLTVTRIALWIPLTQIISEMSSG